MKQKLLFAACTAGVMLLAACSPNTTGSVMGKKGAPSESERSAMMQKRQEELQKFLAEANAANDKTVFNLNPCIAKIAGLLEKQRTKNPAPKKDSGAQSVASLPSSTEVATKMLGKADSCLKYTDSEGVVSYLALDAEGKPLNKWPMAGPRPPVPPKGMMDGKQRSSTPTQR